MIKGIYISASAMKPHVKKQELFANNLANAATSGFKKDRLFLKELDSAVKKTMPRRTDWEEPQIDKIYIDMAPGSFDKTDNPMDLAIEGDGFFQLLSPEGDTVLTRAGSFQVDSNGFLSFPGGFKVVGEGGPIQVGSGTLSISQTGEVEVNGAQINRIITKSINDTSKLERLGGSLFTVPSGEPLIPSINSTLRQGYIEGANVDVVREMVDMMVSYREYEANSKALQQQDASLQNLFNRVAGSR